MMSESRALVLSAAVLILSLLAATPVQAAGTPAVPVPADRWGTLQPAGILGDSTRFEGHTEPVRGNVREYHDVDVENGFLFAATGQGLVVFNLLQNPLPTNGAYIFGYFDGSGAFPVWQHSDKDWYVKEVDAPAGVDSVVALGMEEQGFAVINSANKNGLVVAYQGDLDVSRVYAFTSGSTHFAYAIERSGGRIHRFSLSAAAGMTKCVESPPAVSCPGVYLQSVAGFGTGNRDIQGMGSFVVVSRGGPTGSTRIYNIADPANPVLRLEIPGGNLSATLWQQGGSWLLARLAQNSQITVQDVSCIAAAGACANAPVLATLASATPQLYLKLSLDGGRPYIYVGNDDLGTCAPQREYIYDMSNPAAPAELTPKVHPGGYWGWYYMNCATGFNLIGPRRALVYNGILYRAAYNLLDAHRLQTGPVPARVDAVTASPAAPKVCQPVTFTGVNPRGTPPLTYTWVLDSNGTPVPGVASTTGTLVWNTAADTPTGTYKATVTVTNAHGTDSKNTTVTLSPLPALPAPGTFTPTVDAFSGSAVPFHVNVAGATAWNWDFDGDGIFNEAEWTSDPVNGPNPTFTYSSPGPRQVKVKVRNCVNPAGVVSAAVTVNIAGGRIVINGPDFGQPGQALQFAGVGVDGCTAPADGGWTWTATGGAISGQPNGTVTISWTTLGTKTVTAKNAACPGLTGTRQVKINPKLEACFTSSPPLKLEKQAASFDAGCSVGSPTGVTWDFGDHTPFASGAQVSHVYATPGKYQVTLSVIRAGNDCPPAPFCESSRSELIEVFPMKPTLVAKLEASADEVFTGQPVTFTDVSEGDPTSRTWDFEDGATATASPTSHAYAKAGTFTVKLTVGRDGETATATKEVRVKRPASAVVVPWVSRSRGTSVQTSDLYVHNPGGVPMTVTLEFRRRGLPETSPPRVVRTVAPGATLYAADGLKSLFGRDESLSGFILATPQAESPQPVVTAVQTTGTGSSAYGTVVQGVPVDAVSQAGGLHLAGMNDSSRRTAFFGVTNPGDAPVTYRLRFFDKAGAAIGTPGGDLTLSRLGQRQFQLADIRTQLGVKDKEDYRIVIEPAGIGGGGGGGGGLLPFGVNSWSSTGDPSLAAGGPRSGARLFVIGATNAPGADGAARKTDLVLANPAAQAVPVKLTFVAVGANSTPTAASGVTVAAGETQRLENVLDRQWSVKSAVGVLTIEPGVTGGGGGAFPSALGETYRSALLGKRYGHALPVLADGDAAAAGQAQILAGLRQDAGNRATVWVFNPGPEVGEYDVIYRGLDGAELGRIAVRLAGGRARQLGPPQHPLPEAGVPDGFTVEVRVKAGRGLAAAQVVGPSGDSAYLAGTTFVEERD